MIQVLLAGMIACGVSQTSQPAPTSQPDAQTAQRVDCLEKHSIPFDTVSAGHGFDDLQPLEHLIGDARIVALGEATHGTKEFFQMKHRLVEFLATEMGFTLFAIEANMPEAYRVNDFVSEGKGDPARLIKGMYFWTWSTEEVLDMVRWMRDVNQSGKGRIAFTGFDMQTPDVAQEIVLDFLERYDGGFHEQARKSYAQLKNVEGARQQAPFGVATATFPVSAALGKQIRYSGYIKTQDITRDWAGLWWRVDGKTGVLAFDNMMDRGAKGTTDWTRYEIELKAPEDAANINFGVIHCGDGTAWFDSLKIEIDGEEYANPQLFDLDFESDKPKGFFTGGKDYQVAPDAQVAHTGKHALKLEYRKPSETQPQPESLDPQEAVRKCREVLDHITGAREKYLGDAPAKDVDWALQNARVVHQTYQMLAGDVSRDESMARNVKWILEQAPPDAKIVLWAHNGHVNKVPGWMGAYLDEWYGKDLRVFGFTCNEGRYTAIADQKLQSDNMILPPAPGSFEYYAHATEMPRFILDLRKAGQDSAGCAWLASPIEFRYIGALAMDMQFQPIDLSAAFDAIIYIDKTNASELLGR